MAAHDAPATMVTGKEWMAEFLNVVLTWPTLPYSIVLAFSAIYWMLAATGIVDDGGLSDGGLGDGGDFASGEHGMHGISGMFSRLGLGGAPVMLVVVLLAFFGWTATYFVHLFVLQHLAAPLRWAVGAAVAVLALVPAVPLSAWILRPIRRLLLRLRPVAQESLLGKVGVIASPEASERAGHANVDDGGAGLVLQVRAQPGMRHLRGERVVLVDYLKEHNHYLVIREQDYRGLPFSTSLVAGDKEMHR